MNRIDEPEGQGDERTWTPESGEDFERASENVLDGWPASPPAATGDEESVELPASYEAEAEAEPDVDDPDADGVLADELDEEDAVESALTSTVIDEPPPGEVVETSSEHAPGQLVVPPGYAVLEGQPEGRRRAVGIVVSRFNAHLTDELLAGCRRRLAELGLDGERVEVYRVPGAFELPVAAKVLAGCKRFSAVICLGCVIRGDTPHFDYVASEAASGLQLAAIETGVPVAFGVLTLDRPDQAEPRFAKGAETVVTALEMADLFANLRAAAAR